jgi:hypothetical protein
VARRADTGVEFPEFDDRWRDPPIVGHDLDRLTTAARYVPPETACGLPAKSHLMQAHSTVAPGSFAKSTELGQQNMG